MKCCRVEKFAEPYRVQAYRLIGLLLLSLCFGGGAFAQTLEVEFAQGPFEERRIRDAAFAITDWQELSRQFGLTIRFVVVRHKDNEDWYEKTPRAAGKARELMANAGYPDGFPTPVLIFHDQSTARLAPLVGRELSTIGIESRTQFVAPQDREAAIAGTRYNTGRSRIEIPYVFLTTSRRTPPILEVKPVPDIIAGRPEARFDTASRVLRVRVPIENVGRGVAPPNILALYDRSRTLRLPNVTVPMLGPRSTTYAEIELNVPKSALGQVLQLQALVDSDNSVFELNEQNNLSERVPFKLPEPQPEPERAPDRVPDRVPDLIVEWQNHEFDPDTRQLTIKVTVRNIGAAIAAAQMVDIFSQTGARRDRLIRHPVGPLKAGQSVDLVQGVRLPTSSLGQTLAIAAIADALAQVPETNERNNQSDVQKIAIPPADVLVDLAVNIPKTSVQKGGRSVNATVEIVNRGATTSPSTLLILRSEPDGEIAKVFVPSLRPGTSWTTAQTVTPKFRTTGGTMELFARIDPDNRIPETNKANNQFVRTVILPFPFLIWGAAVALSILILSMIFPLVRARPKPPKSGRDAPENNQPSAPKVGLTYVPRADTGFQQIHTEDDKGIIALELSLRAVADPGHQTLLEEDA